MKYVDLAILLLRLASQFFAWVQQEKVTTQVQRDLMAKAKSEADRIIADAQAARDAVPNDDSVLNTDDGFRRD